MTINDRPLGAVLRTFPKARFAGNVGIAIQKPPTRDLRLAWKGVDCHLGHGLTPMVFALLSPDEGNRLCIKFLGYDEDTRILLYSFGKQGSPLGCAKKGSVLTFGGEFRIDRRPSTHGVPQVDYAIPQTSVTAYEVEPGVFAIEIPAEFVKRSPVATAEATKRAAKSLDAWISENPGICVKRSYLAHLIKEDDSKAAFSRATTEIKNYVRSFPDKVFQIDRGISRQCFIATPPTSSKENDYAAD